MREDKDNSAKWLIEHHGDAILHLSGVRGFADWRAVHPQRTHPTQLPDGLLEVTFPDQDAPVLFVVEVATYPERRGEEQAARDAALVWLDRGVVPEVVTLVLHPKGQFRLSGQWQSASRRGLTHFSVAWTVIELWSLSAEALLALNDVGAVPWVPLTQSALPPDELLRQCRERIDQQAKPQEHKNLLTATQVMADLRYNDSGLLTILRGGRSMSWLSDALSGMDILRLKSLVSAMEECEIQAYAKEHLRKRLEEGEEERVTAEQREAFAQKMMEVVLKLAREQAEQRAREQAEQLAEERSRDELQRAILAVLRDKFSETPEDVAAKVRAILDMEHLRRLISLAGSCPNLDAFRAQLPS